MAAVTHLLRPDADVAANDMNVPYGGPSTWWQAWSDNNTSTGAVMKGFSSCSVEVNYSDPPALAANQRIYRVRSRVLLDVVNTAFSIDYYQALKTVAGTVIDTVHTTTSSGPRDVYGEWKTSNAAGVEWTHTDASSLRLRLYSGDGGGTAPRILEAYAEVEYHHKPTVNTVGPTGTNPGATRSPTITWQTVTDTVPIFHRVKLFTSAQADPENAVAFYDSGDKVVPGVRAHTVQASLPDGTYYMYVKAGVDFRGAEWYSDWAGGTTFTINDTPAIPTNVGPVQGSTVSTSKPTMQGSVLVSALFSPAHLEWQVATDAGFTANVQNMVEVGNFRTNDVSNPGVSKVWTGTRLAQGVWYVRARAVDNAGEAGAWSNGNSFTIAHVPVASGMTPTGSVTLAYGASGTVTFDWDFTDPDSADDYQTAYQVVVERASDSLAVTDSGKVTSGTSAHAFNIPVARKGELLRWRVRLYDRDDKVGPYSANQNFTASDAPNVTITNPSVDELLDTPTPTVTWTPGLAAGRTAASRRVQVYDSAGVEIHDSGTGGGAATSYAIPSNVLVNNRAYSVKVTVTDDLGVAGTKTHTFGTAYDTPQPIRFTVDADIFSERGYVSIRWADAWRDGAWTAYRVYRQEKGEVTWALVEEITQTAATYESRDQIAASGKIYAYAVVQAAIRFGSEVESARPGENRLPSYGFTGTNLGWALGTGVTRIDAAGAGAGGSAGFIDMNDVSAVAVAELRQTNDDDTRVTEGEVMILEADIKISDAVATPSLGLVFADGLNTQETIFPNGSFPAQNLWTRKSLTFTVPTGKIAGYVRAASTTPYDASLLGRSGVDNIALYAAPLYVVPQSDDYWLIDPLDPANTVRLHHVTADSFSEEYESETMLLIGRGRKRDIGTRLGYNGSLTAELWDVGNVTAREQRLGLEKLRSLREALVLRSPFGDLWQVTVGDIAFTRKPGVGQREFGSVTINYTELA